MEIGQKNRNEDQSQLALKGNFRPGSLKGKFLGLLRKSYC